MNQGGRLERFAARAEREPCRRDSLEFLVDDGKQVAHGDGITLTRSMQEQRHGSPVGHGIVVRHGPGFYVAMHEECIATKNGPCGPLNRIGRCG